MKPLLQVTTSERNGRKYYKMLGDRENVQDEINRLFLLHRSWNTKLEHEPFVLDSGMWLGEVSHVAEAKF